MSPPEPLRADLIRAQLGSKLIGSEIVVLDETSSTNDVVRDLAGHGANPGLVVFAESQTGGRGQRGNRWASAAYLGLWFSMLLRPAISIEDSPRLTSWAAQAVADSLRTGYEVDATVKSPNDVVVCGRKIAGVLAEMRAEPRSRHLAIVGIGINVNQGAEDFPGELRARATSLTAVVGKTQDRTILARAVLQHLDRTYHEQFA